MKVIIKTSVESLIVSIGRKGEMLITGNVSGIRKTITDRVQQLAELTHLEKVGAVLHGDIDAMRRGIKQQCPSLHNLEVESSYYV